jgi:hypothetical protein
MDGQFHSLRGMLRLVELKKATNIISGHRYLRVGHLFRSIDAIAWVVIVKGEQGKDWMWSDGEKSIDKISESESGS